MRSCPFWAREAWERCIAPAIRGLDEKWQSKSFRSHSPLTRTVFFDSSKRHALSARWTIRTFFRCTTSARRNGINYIVTELLDGETLREKLSNGALPPRRATDYAIQITQGLASAHEKGVVHRDLKPKNLFITRDGRVKILDFGLAKQTVVAYHADDLTPIRRCTRQGRVNNGTSE
jgi:serine/threonine protein kinase